MQTLYQLSSAELSWLGQIKAYVRMPQSLDYGTLQDGALQHSQQSAVNTAEEKWYTCAVFSSDTAVDVVHFYTYFVAIFSFKKINYIGHFLNFRKHLGGGKPKF